MYLKVDKLKIFFFMSFFCFGLFHEFVACLFLGIEFIYLAYLFFKNDIYVYDNLNFIFMVFIILIYLFVVPFAIDKGMALIGFFKQLSILFFIIILMQFSKKDRDELLLMIPYIGLFMVFISVIAYFIPSFYSFFIVNGRIGGFFQYPNTFALFLLIGCIVLYFHEDSYKYPFIYLFILLAGILLTGSRTIYVFTLLMFIYFCIKDHKYLKFVSTIILFFIITVIFVNIFGINIKVLNRLTQFTLSSSTLLGRLLYFKDGLKVCFSHPLGLGYLGYYFLEPSIQTGVYSIRFVHNDILQLGLDVGILPCLLFIVVFINSFISTRVNKENKIIILIILLHSLFEFNLQFVSIFLILVICLNLYDGKKSKLFSKKHKILSNSTILLGAIVSMYIGISLSFHYFGYTDLSIKCLPIYTEAKISKLQTIDDIEKGLELAKNIEKYNSHVSIVYDIYAINEMQQNHFSQMMLYKEKSLDLQKYNIATYDDYIDMLFIAEEYYKEDDIERDKFIEKIKTIPYKIKTIKEDTDSLAYKIYDKPDLELSAKSKKIISYIENLDN